MPNIITEFEIETIPEIDFILSVDVRHDKMMVYLAHFNMPLYRQIESLNPFTEFGQHERWAVDAGLAKLVERPMQNMDVFKFRIRDRVNRVEFRFGAEYLYSDCDYSYKEVPEFVSQFRICENTEFRIIEENPFL